MASEEDQKKEERTQPPSPQLKYEIVVTATRLETPVKEIASSVTVITRDDLDRMKKTTVIEALEQVLGLTLIQNGPAGAASSVLIRGANSEHTLVMLDGVELNDPISPSRSCDLAHLSLANVDRIEILRGAQSTLYGSDALGGVINIITRKGEGKPQFSFSSLAGSFGTLSSLARFSGSKDKIHYSLATSYLRTDGFSAASTAYEGNEEKDGYRNFTLSANLSYALREGLDVSLSVRTINTKSDIDNFGGPYGDDTNSIQYYKSLILKGEMRELLFQNRWEQKLSFSLVDHDRNYENPADEVHLFESEQSRFRSKQWKFDWQHNLYLHRSNTLTFGLVYAEEQGHSEYHSESLWGPYSSAFPLQSAHNTGFYIQDQLRWGKRFFATIGARLDIHSQAGKALTFRIAPAFLIEQTGTKFKATYGTGFKSPSLYQLFAPETLWGPVGNESLKPEESKTWDFGVEQTLLGERLFLGITLFASLYENLIDFDFTRGFINILKASSQGAEVSLRAKPTRSLLLKALYTRTRAKDEETEKPLLRRPEDQFTAELNLQFLDKGRLDLSFIYIGKREDMEWIGWTSHRVSMPSYTLVNAVISYDLSDNHNIFLHLQNILNQEYEIIKGYGTPGFSAYGGFRIRF